MKSCRIDSCIFFLFLCFPILRIRDTLNFCVPILCTHHLKIDTFLKQRIALITQFQTRHKQCLHIILKLNSNDMIRTKQHNSKDKHSNYIIQATLVTTQTTCTLSSQRCNMKRVGHTCPNSSPTPEDRLVTRTETLCRRSVPGTGCVSLGVE